MKRLKKAIFCISITMLLTGCGKDKVEYVTETNTPTDSVSTDISMDSVAEKVGFDEELWEEAVDDSTVKRIYANVTVPDVTGMKVIDVEMLNHQEDPEAKENVLKAFAEGEIYRFDEGYIPKPYYQADVDYYQSVIDANGDNMDEWVLERYNELFEIYNNAPDDYVVADDFEPNSYRIDYDNLNMLVSFRHYNEYGTSNNSIMFTLEDTNSLVEEPNKNVMVEYGAGGEYLSDDNRCTMTVEEAQEKAEDFVAKFNAGDFEVVGTEQIEFNVYYGELGGYTYTETENYYDGYVFHFFRSIDGVTVDGNIYHATSDAVDQALDAAGAELNESYTYTPVNSMEQITVFVNDKGVFDATYNSPVEIKEVVADNVNLLSYDNIKNVVIQEMQNKDYYQYVTLRHMELTYFLWHDKINDKYSIVPVWRASDDSPQTMLYESMFFGYGDTHFIVANAMDGSIINVGEQMISFYKYEPEETYASDEYDIE